MAGKECESVKRSGGRERQLEKLGEGEVGEEAVGEGRRSEG